MAAEARSNLAQYSGAERAAIAVLSLGEQASGLMRLLHEDEVREISGAMSSLGVVPAPIVEAVLTEFFSKFSGAGVIMGSMEQAERTLLNVLPKDRVDVIMEELRGPAGRSVWDKLGNVSVGLLTKYLVNEYPQTVAVVLSKVPADVAASVLAALPHDFAVEAMERMLTLETVHRDVLQNIESVLRSEFISNLNRSSRRDNHEAMAEIFNNLDRQTEAKFLSSIEDKAQTSAERIRSLMFVFDDLAKLDSTAVQTMLRSIDKQDLAVALKGASEQMRALFFSNMSERGGKLLREEIQALGPVRVRDVDAAQARIVAVAKDLSARGEIVLAANNQEDELIY